MAVVGMHGFRGVVCAREYLMDEREREIKREKGNGWACEKSAELQSGLESERR